MKPNYTDARLIAAAPEMLDLLKSLTGCEVMDKDRKAFMSIVVYWAKQIIDKVEGK